MDKITKNRAVFENDPYNYLLAECHIDLDQVEEGSYEDKLADLIQFIEKIQKTPNQEQVHKDYKAAYTRQKKTMEFDPLFKLAEIVPKSSELTDQTEQFYSRIFYIRLNKFRAENRDIASTQYTIIIANLFKSLIKSFKSIPTISLAFLPIYLPSKFSSGIFLF